MVPRPRLRLARLTTTRPPRPAPPRPSSNLRLLVAWLLALAALVAAPAHAALPPRPAGPVLDQANVIPDAEETALDAKLRAYNAATGRAVIVATVNSLDDLPIEDYAQQLSEAWDIGGAKTEEGVLLLV